MVLFHLRLLQVIGIYQINFINLISYKFLRPDAIVFYIIFILALISVASQALYETKNRSILFS